jgi:PAS domain S-box-containing protein
MEKANYNILIVEDNPGDLVLVEELLLEQIEVPLLAHAKNFQEAKRILSKGNNLFDIILLDLALPDKTGIPLIQEMIELSLTTPVIILTGYNDPSFGIKALSLGVSDYILKDELTAVSLFKSIVYSSERKNVALALEESERQYNELFNLSPQPMFVFELESLKFLDVNEAFIRYYGYTREEFFQMDLREIRPPGEIPAFEMGILSDSKDHKNDNLGVFKHLKKNGEIIQVDIKSNFINYKGKNAKVTIATDVTERLNYIKAIETQNEKLKEISWIQSHIIRTPLARIMGLIEIFKDIQEDSEEKKQMLEYLLSSANELDEVIMHITDLSGVGVMQKT